MALITLTKAEEEALVLLADNAMNVTRVAEESHFSRSVIYDRLRSVRIKTGINPMDFWGLHRLLSLIEEGKEENN